MKPQNITYDVCRCYMRDNISTLPEEIYNKVHGFLRARSISQLATCTSLATPNIVGVAGWRTLMQIEAFFKKNTSFASSSLCLQNAMSSFKRGERICGITNRRLEHYYLHPGRLNQDMERYVSRMQNDLACIMGDFQPFLDNLPSLVRVTSGATSTKSRRQALPHLRISKRPYGTRRAIPYLEALSQYFGYGTLKSRIVSTNRVEFVPKNWKTDRTIACEPEGNMFLQLAFDSYTKRRLKRIGVNLSSQFRNQVLAKQGSVSGEFATVDLSMASDTLSFNTVALLFPRKWFQYLRDVRSPRSRGKISCTYNKFSSMGNGCTFALETLVFAAAVRAVGSKTYAVYGDDIVIEKHLVPELQRVLRYLGFLFNQDKTHCDGPFRESCGANWFDGIDVTPKYIRELDSRKAVMCHLVNSLVTITYPGEELWAYLFKLVKQLELPLAPFSEATTSGVFVCHEVARRLGLIRGSNQSGYWIPKVKCYIPIAPQRRNYDSRSLFLWYLDTAKREGEISRPTVRSRYTVSSHRYRRKWVHWREPAVGAPLQLDCWSDQFLP
jgi:hypothetical protein